VQPVLNAPNGSDRCGVGSPKLIIFIPSGCGDITDDVVTFGERAQEAGVRVINLPISGDLWPRDQLPQALFAPPQFGAVVAILECRPFADASAAFAVLSTMAYVRISAPLPDT